MVVDDHLELHLGRTHRAGLLEQTAREQLADPLAPPARDDADPAEPGAGAAPAEIGKAHGRSVCDGNQRSSQVEVEDVDHVPKGRLVDGEGDEVSLVGSSEQRRQLAVGELGRRPELHGHSSMMPDQPTWKRTTCLPPANGTQTSPKAVAAGNGFGPTL